MNTVINSTIEAFKNSRIGQLVCINDVDLLIELDGKHSPNFTIKDKITYAACLSHYIILTLDHIGTDVDLLLVCSIFKDVCDVKLFQQPEFFEPDKRQVLMEGNNSWLFDGEYFPEEIYNGDITYKKKSCQNELFGNTCLIEWTTDAKIINYELLLLETGFKHDGGGWVEFYEGRQIQEKDVVF